MSTPKQLLNSCGITCSVGGYDVIYKIKMILFSGSHFYLSIAQDFCKA